MPAITDYSSLKQEVANELSRQGIGDLAGRIPRWIQQGEQRLFAKLRVREMEASANVTVTTSTQTSALPTRWVDGRVLYIAGSPPLEFRTLQEFWHIYANLPTAQPTYYTISGEDLVWAPLPDAGYTVVAEYFQKPAAFSADADTNSVLTTYPDVYLYAACLAGAASLGNGGLMAGYAQLFEDAVEYAHAASRADRMGGDVVPPMRAAQMT